MCNGVWGVKGGSMGWVMGGVGWPMGDGGRETTGGRV